MVWYSHVVFFPQLAAGESDVLCISVRQLCGSEGGGRGTREESRCGMSDAARLRTLTRLLYSNSTE